MKHTVLPLAVLGLAIALPARGDPPTALAQKYACFTCHAVDQKLIGPSWKAIAQRYRGQKGAEQTLIAKIRTGSVGAWGSEAMPPNPAPSDADLKELVDYILSVK